jgi:hypothetical protein
LKQYIKEIYNEEEHDGFIFVLEEDDVLDVSPFTYKDNSEAIEMHELGFKYHVVIYKETFDGELVDPEKFEAIIGDPYHYASNLIKAGFFGTICKKTKTSLKVVNDMYDDLLSSIEDQYITEEEK